MASMAEGEANSALEMKHHEEEESSSLSHGVSRAMADGAASTIIAITRTPESTTAIIDETVRDAAQYQEVLFVEEEFFDDEEPTGGTMSNHLLSISNNRTSDYFQWSPSALAFSNTTPWLARILFPTVCLVTHILFYYGQTAPMWKLRLVADIDVWANATDFTTKQTFNLIGVPIDNHFVYQKDKDVQTFTYYYAIHHLWMAKGIPGKVLPRFAAVLLILFSGAWPHLKLIWLQATWFFRKQAAGRTTTLQWLSTLGKWSLADVLVVCVMVGVLNLDWIVDPAAIQKGVIEDLPAILEIVESQYDENGLCNKLLKLHCEHAKKATTRAKCQACIKAVSEAYTRPDWAQSTGKSLLKGVDTSGGGSAILRVVGMSGIYAFCGAVIVSILLSLMVDIFDHRAKQDLQKRRARDEASRRIIDIQEVASPTSENELSEPLLGDGPLPLEVDSGADASFYSRPLESRDHMFSLRFLVGVISTLALVLAAVDWDTMERKVSGAGPELLQDILGINWERKYSLQSLMWTTGAHGGLDVMLMGTFGLFCVLGPVIRAALLVLVALLDRCSLPVEGVANMVNFIGAFCSWEVFGIAIVMVQMLMPSITNTIVRNKVCAKISDDGSCLQVEFNLLPWTFWTIVLGGLLLAVSSCVAVGRGTDRSSPIPSSTPRSRTALLRRHHDYERLQGVGQGTSESIEEGLDQLVFETNDL